MNEFILGEQLLVYIYDDEASAYKPIACLTGNSLNTSLEVIETQTKCQAGLVVKGAGGLSYSVDMEGNYIDTTSSGGLTERASHDALLLLQQSKSFVTWKIDTGLSDVPNYYGTAIITDLSAEFPAGNEFATFSATFDGSGDILRSDPKEV